MRGLARVMPALTVLASLAPSSPITVHAADNAPRERPARGGRPVAIRGKWRGSGQAPKVSQSKQRKGQRRRGSRRLKLARGGGRR